MIIISMLYSVGIMIAKIQGSGQQNEAGSIVFSGIMVAMLFGVPCTALMFNMTGIFSVIGSTTSNFACLLGNTSRVLHLV